MLLPYACRRSMLNITSVNFFNNLVRLKKLNIIGGEDGIEGVVYLPFNPHFFHMVNSNDDIQAHYAISYLKQSEICHDNHRLSHSIFENDNFESLKKDLNEEERHITTSKTEILNYDAGMLITKERCKSLLLDLGEVTEIRYIVLKTKCRGNPSNICLKNYLCYNCNFLSDINFGLRSKLVRCQYEGVVVKTAYTILQTLIRSTPDSLHGIAIVADNPECNPAMLNVKRPGVLRQYYGQDIKLLDDNMVRRVAYRSQLSFKSEGSDPFKLIIKPFSTEMNNMATYFHSFLIRNRIQLELEDVNLNSQFNSCTVLLYHTLLDIKEESKMGWHCDSKFSLSGKFMENSNGQKFNTPVLIFTIGKSR